MRSMAGVWTRGSASLPTANAGRSAYTVRGYKGEDCDRRHDVVAFSNGRLPKGGELPNEPNSVQAGVESLVWESQKRTQMGHTAGAFASQAGTARVSPLQPMVVRKPDPPSGDNSKRDGCAAGGGQSAWGGQGLQSEGRGAGKSDLRPKHGMVASKKRDFGKRTQVCASRRGKLFRRKPKTNPNTRYDSGVRRHPVATWDTAWSASR